MTVWSSNKSTPLIGLPAVVEPDGSLELIAPDPANATQNETWPGDLNDDDEEDVNLIPVPVGTHQKRSEELDREIQGEWADVEAEDKATNLWNTYHKPGRLTPNSNRTGKPRGKEIYHISRSLFSLDSAGELVDSVQRSTQTQRKRDSDDDSIRKVVQSSGKDRHGPGWIPTRHNATKHPHFYGGKQSADDAEDHLERRADEFFSKHRLPPGFRNFMHPFRNRIVRPVQKRADESSSKPPFPDAFYNSTHPSRNHKNRLFQGVDPSGKAKFDPKETTTAEPTAMPKPTVTLNPIFGPFGLGPVP